MDKKPVKKSIHKDNIKRLSLKHVIKETSSKKLSNKEKSVNKTVAKQMSKKLKSEPIEDLKSEHKDNINITSHEDNTLITSQNINAMAVLKKPSVQTKLINLVNLSDDINEMLEYYKTKIKNVIEIPKIEINKKKVNGPIITRSFRIYEAVLKDFIKFSEKHNQYSMQDLLSQSIIEFIERYH